MKKLMAATSLAGLVLGLLLGSQGLTTTHASSAAAAAGPHQYCGLVKSYDAPTATQAGRIVIGSRTYSVATDVEFGSGVTVGPGNRCIAGQLDDAGQFVSISSAHPYGMVGPSNVVTFTICGTVADYRPATATSDGLLVFENGRETVIPAGTTLPLAPGANPGDRCFSGDLNSAGDAIITGTTPPTGAGGQPVATLPATLPSTAASDGGSPSGLLSVALILVGSSAALATWLWTRRRTRTDIR